MDYMGSMRQGGFQPDFNMQGVGDPTQASQGFYYPYTPEQMYMFAQLQQHRAMLGHGHLQPAKHNDPKPRLSKEEVEILEREFEKNPKPSSSLKRELAERMVVELARINNWFQNRRAKEKQLKKAREFEAQQVAISSSDSQDQPGVSEFYPHSNHQQPLQPSTAAFPAQPTRSSHSERDDSATSETASVDASNTSAAGDDSDSAEFEEYPSPRSLSFSGAEDANLDLTPMGVSFLSPEAHAHLQNALSQAGVGMPVASYQDRQGERAENPQTGDRPDIRLEGQLASPVSTDQSSPATDMRFKSPPPPANIASRRNKHLPAQLNPTALRSAYGPRTGLDKALRVEAPSPMRRIASASGMMPGRIQKAMMGCSSPRSPMHLERTKEALMRSLHDARSPTLQSLNTAMSPVTPGEGSVCSQRDARAATVSSSASDEERRYAFGSAQTPLFGIDALKSPPETPGVRQYPEQPICHNNSMEGAWVYAPRDEPLVTPGLGSFGSDDFSLTPSAPGYVSSSQPPTPSFAPSVGPTYYSWGFNGNGPGNTEYTFPESYVPDASAASSPGLSQSKLFQFTQNITPQDFGTER